MLKLIEINEFCKNYNSGMVTSEQFSVWYNKNKVDYIPILEKDRIHTMFVLSNQKTALEKNINEYIILEQIKEEFYCALPYVGIDLELEVKDDDLYEIYDNINKSGLFDIIDDNFDFHKMKKLFSRYNHQDILEILSGFDITLQNNRSDEVVDIYTNIASNPEFFEEFNKFTTLNNPKLAKLQKLVEDGVQKSIKI